MQHNTNGYLFLLGVFLEDFLDDTDGDGVLHVSDGETTKGRVLGEGLHAHGLGGTDFDSGAVADLDELGVLFQNLSASSVDLLVDLLELARDVGGVAIEDGGVAVGDLAGVVEHDDLGGEVLALLGGVVLGVRRDVASLQVLDVDVLDVEADVVAGVGLGQHLVVHFDRLDLSRQVGGREDDHHAGLEHAGLHSAHGHRAHAADLVHVVDGEAEGLVESEGKRDPDCLEVVVVGVGIVGHRLQVVWQKASGSSAVGVVMKRSSQLPNPFCSRRSIFTKIALHGCFSQTLCST